MQQDFCVSQICDPFVDDVLVLHVDDQLHGGPCLKRNGGRELQPLQQSTLTRSTSIDGQGAEDVAEAG